MCISSYLLLLRLFVLFTISLSGCASLQEKIYVGHPVSLHRQVEMVCLNTDASHFIVRDIRVWLKQNDGKEIELKHYKSLLPDGYYFCKSQERKSSILD